VVRRGLEPEAVSHWDQTLLQEVTRAGYRIAHGFGEVLSGAHETPYGQPLSALLTAWMMNATVTSALLGTLFGHADGWAVLSAMFTRVITSLIVTSPSPLQSPMHGIGVRVGVGVGVAVGV